MDILITGGSGRLGTAIQKQIECIATRIDILRLKYCYKAINDFDPDVIIHCAAYTNSLKAEQEKDKCFNLNVVGTRNMLRASNGRRFIYISSDYVFDGEQGNYTENDIPNPINYYGLTKLLGEAETQCFYNTLVIRTAFKGFPFEHKKAFTDQWTSGVFVDERATDIIKLALGNEAGLIHVGNERRTIYDMVRGVQNVGKISIKDVGVNIPKDVSLNSSKWGSMKHLV